MTLSPVLPSLSPSVDDFTHNSEASGSVVASYDLLCLPGMIVSFLDNDTFTTSTGNSAAVAKIYVADVGRHPQTECVSVGSTDSSVLAVGMPGGEDSCGGFANQFRFPFREAASVHLAALMMLLGGFVALLVETAEQSLHSGPLAVKSDAE